MARPGNARDIAAERERNDELEAEHGRCVVCHAPLEAPKPKRGGGHRPRDTCSNRCRQYRHRHPDEVDLRASAGWSPGWRW